VIATGTPQRLGAAPAGKSLRESFRTDFDLARVQPGTYVLTLEGRVPQERNKTVTRQIPFTIE
jgi:hypothetical protein